MHSSAERREDIPYSMARACDARDHRALQQPGFPSARLSSGPSSPEESPTLFEFGVELLSFLPALFQFGREPLDILLDLLVVLLQPLGSLTLALQIFRQLPTLLLQDVLCPLCDLQANS
jgi:hypothetical protein